MAGFQKVISSIEAEKLPRTFLMLGVWIFLRIFFEGILEAAHHIGYIPFSYKALVIFFIHYPSFYLSLFVVLVIITGLLIREKVERVSAVFATGFGVVLLVPILDWFIGGGYYITYPLRLEPYLASALNPFVSIIEYGASPGQRITFTLICILIAAYAYLKTKKIAFAFILFFIAYFVIIILGGLPTIIAGNRPEDFYITGGILYSDTQKFASIFLLMLFIASIIYCYLVDPKSFKLALTSLRPERALFYAGVGIAGLILSLHYAGVTIKSQFPYLFDRIGILILGLSLILGFQGASGINDFFDTQGDRFTRPRNPLLKNISRRYYFAWTIMLSSFALACAWLINYVSFLIMLSLILISIIYSVPPIRLKRIPVVSTFVLAIAVVLSLAMGFSILNGGEALYQIPKSILIPTLISITIGFCAKDLQDIEGDKNSGVITIPILISIIFGNARRIPVAFIIGVSYLIYPLFIPNTLVGALCAALITIFYTIFIKNTKEWVYFIFLYLFSSYLVFTII